MKQCHGLESVRAARRIEVQPPNSAHRDADVWSRIWCGLMAVFQDHLRNIAVCSRVLDGLRDGIHFPRYSREESVINVVRPSDFLGWSLIIVQFCFAIAGVLSVLEGVRVFTLALQKPYGDRMTRHLSFSVQKVVSPMLPSFTVREYCAQ